MPVCLFIDSAGQEQLFLLFFFLQRCCVFELILMVKCPLNSEIKELHLHAS